MSSDDSNPYQASAIDPKPPAGPRETIEYMRAVNYVTESPQWTMNLLWGGLCVLSTQIIPIVGQVLLMGYQFEIVEDLVRNPHRHAYLDFDMNRFKEYLVRGLWIFLVMLVAMLVIMPIVGVVFVGGVMIVGGIGAAAGGNNDAVGVAMIVMFAVMMIVMILFSLVLTIVITPLTIRAGLTQDFRASFDMAWIKDFVRKMWLETLIAQLFLIAVAVFAYILGLLACIIGVFPAVGFIMMVQAHLFLQLYQLYLARGGEPILLKSESPFQEPKPEPL